MPRAAQIPPLPLPLQIAERMRANAAALEAMASGRVRLERRALHGLVEDLRDWSGALEGEAMAQARMTLRMNGTAAP